MKCSILFTTVVVLVFNHQQAIAVTPLAEEIRSSQKQSQTQSFGLLGDLLVKLWSPASKPEAPAPATPAPEVLEEVAEEKPKKPATTAMERLRGLKASAPPENLAIVKTFTKGLINKFHQVFRGQKTAEEVRAFVAVTDGFDPAAYSH